MKKNNIIIFSNDNFNFINKFLYFQNKNTLTIIDILRDKFKVRLILKKIKLKKIKKKKLKMLLKKIFLI